MILTIIILYSNIYEIEKSKYITSDYFKIRVAFCAAVAVYLTEFFTLCYLFGGQSVFNIVHARTVLLIIFVLFISSFANSHKFLISSEASIIFPSSFFFSFSFLGISLNLDNLCFLLCFISHFSHILILHSSQ